MPSVYSDEYPPKWYAFLLDNQFLAEQAFSTEIMFEMDVVTWFLPVLSYNVLVVLTWHFSQSLKSWRLICSLRSLFTGKHQHILSLKLNPDLEMLVKSSVQTWHYLVCVWSHFSMLMCQMQTAKTTNHQVVYSYRTLNLMFVCLIYHYMVTGVSSTVLFDCSWHRVIQHVKS